MYNHSAYSVNPRVVEGISSDPRLLLDAEVIVTPKEQKDLRLTLDKKTIKIIRIILFVFIYPSAILGGCYLTNQLYNNTDESVVFCGIGFILQILIFIFMLLISSLIGKAIVSILYPEYMNKLLNNKRDAKKKDYENTLRYYQYTIQEAKVEAQELSNKLNDILDKLPEQIPNLTLALQYATEWLQQARFEFGDNAYGPFWDAIERTLLQLAYYYDQLQGLQKTARFYYTSLVGREHNFPELPFQLEMIPNPVPII